MAGELVLSPEEQARQEAANYLASQGVGGYSAAPAPPPAMSSDGGQSLPPVGPPPPPPVGPVGGSANVSKSVIVPALKRAAISTVAPMLGGLPGGIIANAGNNADTTAKIAMKPDEPAQGAPTLGSPAGPPPPPGQEIPIVRSVGGAGGAPAGMYPNENKMEAHLGRPVPREAKGMFGAGTELQMAAADKQAQADHDYYTKVKDAAALRMEANEDAARQHQLVQIDRGMAVQQRMAEIEALNNEASAKISDPWNDRSAGSRILGALVIGLGGIGDRMAGRAQNGALAVIQSAMNQEVATQLKNRELAAQKAGRTQNLLNLHLEQLGSEDKAIDATKVGLLDNVLAKIDQYAAENKANVSDANVLKLKGELLQQRGELLNKIALQELDDVKVERSDKYHQATGGGPGAIKGEEHIIEIPSSDGTKKTYVAVPKDVHEDLSKMSMQTAQLQKLNRDALDARRQLREVTSYEYVKEHPFEAARQRATLMQRLDSLNQDRVMLAQKAKDPNSAVRDQEFNRELEKGVDYTAGFLGRRVGVDVEKEIQHQDNLMTGRLDAATRAVAGRKVAPVRAVRKEGGVDVHFLPTGQLYEGGPVAPEKK